MKQGFFGAGKFFPAFKVIKSAVSNHIDKSFNGGNRLQNVFFSIYSLIAVIYGLGNFIIINTPGEKLHNQTCQFINRAGCFLIFQPGAV